MPELGTIKATHIPLVVLTSNNAREMSDALKRRCLHLYIDFPDREQELASSRSRCPGVAERLAGEVVGGRPGASASSTSRRRRASARRSTGRAR